MYSYLDCFSQRAYMLLASDTDSIFVAMAEESLEKMEKTHIKPGFEKSYYEAKKELLYDGSQPEKKWEPGLFHCEYPSGFQIGIFLAPKSYILSSFDDEIELILKMAGKGVSYRFRSNLSYIDYQNVNHKRARKELSVTTLRYYRGRFHFLMSDKNALSFLNVKRYWLDDCLNSTTLNV